MLSRSTAASRAALARASSSTSSLLAVASTSSYSAANNTASSSRLYSLTASSSTPASSGVGAASSLPTTQPRSLNPAPTPQAVRQWFAKALPSLPPLPDDVAAQVITHDSWDLGLTGGPNAGHSRRLSFVGRRALNLFLSLFLSTQHLPLSNVDTLLHTAVLGERAGATLRLHEVMRWTPARGDGTQRESGLWKIRGTTVEALVGAVYHQFGAATARHFFNAHILPHLSVAPSARAAVEAAATDSLAALKRLTSPSSSPSPSPSSASSSASVAARSTTAAQATTTTTERYVDAATTTLGHDSALGARGGRGAQTNASRSAASTDSWAREASRTKTPQASSSAV